MKATARHLRIRELLESQEFVDQDALSAELHASESSIRRDLITLESEGVLKRVYGGAMAMQPRGAALDFDSQSARMTAEKRRIAALAATLIEDNQTILLDGGSTVAAVAAALLGRSLHVMTNSLAIAEVFRDARQIDVTLTGGYVYPRLRALLGPLCEQMIASITADVLILGIGGITESGFSNSNTLVVGPERKMIEAARKVIVVADHTKFGHAAVTHLAPLEVADIVVSNAELAQEYQSLLRQHGVQLLLA